MDWFPNLKPSHSASMPGNLQDVRSPNPPPHDCIVAVAVIVVIVVVVIVVIVIHGLQG